MLCTLPLGLTEVVAKPIGGGALESGDENIAFSSGSLVSASEAWRSYYILSTSSAVTSWTSSLKLSSTAYSYAMPATSLTALYSMPPASSASSVSSSTSLLSTDASSEVILTLISVSSAPWRHHLLPRALRHHYPR